MSKIDEVRSAMMQAMKNGEKHRKDALSIMLSALKNKFIDKRADLTEDEENMVVLKEIKQCRETIEASPSDRTDIIDECNLRIAVYSEFAPKQFSREEIKKAVGNVLQSLGLSEPSVKDKGIIMKNLMPQLKGKSEGAAINEVLSEFLK